MKLINTKLALSALGIAMLATPALAQRPEHQASQQQQQQQSQLQAPTANDVVVDGRFIGADPDPNVRLELRRDAYGSSY
jgi:hypothetical protein